MTGSKTLKTPNEIMVLVHRYGRKEYTAGKTGHTTVTTPDTRDVILAELDDRHYISDGAVKVNLSRDAFDIHHEMSSGQRRHTAFKVPAILWS